MLPILNQSFWRDEAFSVLLALKSPWEIVSLTIKDTNPPWYYLLLHIWMMLFGSSEAAVRGMSFTFHVLTVLISMLISRKLKLPTPVTLMIGLTVLLNPFLLLYAFEARAYSLLALTATASIWLILEKRYFWASLMLGMGVLSHNFGFFNLAAVGCWWLGTHRASMFTQHLKTSLRLFVIPAVTVLTWGSIMWRQWAQVAGGFWIKPATTSVWLLSLQKYSSGDIGYTLQSNVYLLSFIVIFFASSYWIWRSREDKHSAAIWLLVAMTFLPTAITYVLSALFSPIYLERYLLSAIPCAILLVGYSLYQAYVHNQHIRSMLIALVSVYLALIVIASEEIVGSSTKSPINYAVDQVLAQAQPGDIIVPESQLNFLETKWYVQSRHAAIPVYTYSQDGKIPFYIGSILYEPSEIITTLPAGTRIWQIKPDASTTLITR